MMSRAALRNPLTGPSVSPPAVEDLMAIISPPRPLTSRDHLGLFTRVVLPVMDRSLVAPSDGSTHTRQGSTAVGHPQWGVLGVWLCVFACVCVCGNATAFWRGRLYQALVCKLHATPEVVISGLSDVKVWAGVDKYVCPICI
ncbi:uncharacterized protein B0I36DRAFT_322533 [Microdochium trichocladiopsis]|uniref:Uncharacterized protein n=1 Tax=Microdochium trichocladiopsis TaxID=1682393 RepID=A0A9P8Y612_9PEZI|nr:uncharacterized protein B0I36DRAFT_322533 [Microdochium trichocladiopsis]KAH7030820.1 hypothetical protein B0I36DRAFT_322533 [Microdochium trichocladiopsis]